jgi:hypothetical protein
MKRDETTSPGLFLDRKTGWLIDKRLRQTMAPTVMRIITHMEVHTKPIDAIDLAEKVHADRNGVAKYLGQLHEAGIIRIAGWRKPREGSPGAYSRLFAMADGKRDKPHPPLPHPTKTCRERRERLRALLGEHYGAVNQSRHKGGAEVLSIAGHLVYRRGSGVDYDALRRAQGDRL